ncbi:MAG: hypothetical protein MJE63_28410 [Proteobacteria bacterium]|nr:hypothetical protein [Pseudomonadota bacterium]
MCAKTPRSKIYLYIKGLFIMVDILKIIKEAGKDDSLYQYNNDQLVEMIESLLELESKAQSIIEEREAVEEDDSDDEFIEVVINGQPDLIKRTIEVLNISCNEFKTLPPAIYKLKKLKKLYLYNNSFSEEEKKKIRASFPPHVQIHF